MNKLHFGIIIHQITPNSKDLVKEIKKRGFLASYLYFNSILNQSKTEIIFKNNKGEQVNNDQFDILLWRDTDTPAVIRKVIASYFLQKGKIFIDKIWATRDWTGNKLRQVEFFSRHGLPIPKTLFVNQFISYFKKSPQKLFQKIIPILGLPFIAKPIVGAQGENVLLIKSQKDFQKLKKGVTGESPLFQEFIPNDGDFRALVINKKFIGAYKRIPKKGEFRANLAQGGRGQKIKPESKLISLSKKVAELIGIEILGVDIIRCQKSKKYYVLETNGIPQWQGFKKTTGIDVAEKIIDYCLSYYK